MKRKTLLVFAGMSVFISASRAQVAPEVIKGFAITSAEKGGRSWKEVRMINVQSGEEMQSVFGAKSTIKPLNARTKRPVVSLLQASANTPLEMRLSAAPVARKVVNLDDELEERKVKGAVRVVRAVSVKKEDPLLPFATNSAAMAYDEKHNRLYFTPMGINQLRYIDLKSGKVYYFENEAFGNVANFSDVKNQITRMVIASDGNGYALSNDAQHLLRFTTGKKPVISDLGPVIQSEPGKVKIGTQYGGDMVADASGNLYLISAHRNVFKINIESKAAEYLGTITGLPKGYSTNGAMVEGGSKVIVCSSESTEGYYRFDLNTLKAEKISTGASVFNASDLANGVLAFEKKKKKNEKPAIEEESSMAKETSAEKTVREPQNQNSIRVYPNPVTDGRVKISLSDHPAGKYQIQVMDMAGKMIANRAFAVNYKNQLEELSLPDVAKGSYVIKIVNEAGEVRSTEKIVVQ